MRPRRFLILALVSILIRLVAFHTIKLKAENYTDGHFVKIGLGYPEYLEYCALKNSGINYFKAKNSDFPPLILSILSKLCHWDTKTADGDYEASPFLLFIIITIIDMLQGILIYVYLHKSYECISFPCEKSIDMNTYSDHVFNLIAFHWLNPLTVYSSLTLPIVSNVELLLMFLILWLSLDTKLRKTVSILLAFLVYLDPRKYLSLIPILTYNSFKTTKNMDDSEERIDEYLKLNNDKKTLLNKVRFAARVCLDLKNKPFNFEKDDAKLLLNFLTSFAFTLTALHIFSCIFITKMHPMDYFKKFVSCHFSFSEKRDLTPYLNFYWFLMTTIMKSFKFYFQLVLSSFLVLYSINLLIGFKNVLHKALIAQFFLIHILAESPTLSNYILVLMFISFDYLVTFKSKLEPTFSISFLICFSSILLSVLIRPIWITQNRLGSNAYYFITFTGNVTFLFIIGEWTKDTFNHLVKEQRYMSLIKKPHKHGHIKEKNE